jgi:hypothetical protein
MTTLLAPFASPIPALPASALPPAPTGPIDDRAERVARGAAFLDRAVPGWVDRFTPKVLHWLRMESCLRCILGSLYGWFPYGVHLLSGRADFDDEAALWAHAHGFFEDGSCDYDALRDLWVAAIRARRGAGAEAEA